jgi:hypothetical protein
MKTQKIDIERIEEMEKNFLEAFINKLKIDEDFEACKNLLYEMEIKIKNDKGLSADKTLEYAKLLNTHYEAKKKSTDAQHDLNKSREKILKYKSFFENGEKDYSKCKVETSIFIILGEKFLRLSKAVENLAQKIEAKM